jgi:hypothetical protein
MRLRRAVPQIPPRSFVPRGLRLCKSRLFLTRSESTLPQVLIPLHFNSRRINVYKKPVEGVPPLYPKVLQLVNRHTKSSRIANLFGIRTSTKRACKSRRIRTSKTQDLKSLRIRIYEKNQGEGEGARVSTSSHPYLVTSHPHASSTHTRTPATLRIVSCRLSATCTSTADGDYLPRNFSMVVSSASAMSRYFFAPLVSCFCIAVCALPRSILMRCWAETMSPRRP